MPKRRSIPAETDRLLSVIELHLPYLQNAARAYDGQAEHHYHLIAESLSSLRKLYPRENPDES